MVAQLDTEKAQMLDVQNRDIHGECRCDGWQATPRTAARPPPPLSGARARAQVADRGAPTRPSAPVVRSVTAVRNAVADVVSVAPLPAAGSTPGTPGGRNHRQAPQALLWLIRRELQNA